MCLILMAWHAHRDYPLVIGANRDEFYDRPTAAAGPWADSPGVLAGRDLLSGGTWLGIDVRGRFAALSNFRDGQSPPLAQAPSRGLLVADHLRGSHTVAQYLSALEVRGCIYNGFNLIFGDLSTVYYYGNRAPGPRRLAPGVYGLSNHLLDTPWPKIERGKAGLRRLLSASLDCEAVLALLADREIAPDSELPDTGIGIERERLLSPLFIESPSYGTRASTVLWADREGRLGLVERCYDGPRETTRRFEIDLGSGRLETARPVTGPLHG